MHNKTTVALKPNSMSSLSLCAVFLLICFTLKILNFRNLVAKIFASHIFGLKCVLPIFHVKAAQDDISAKTVPN